MKRGDVTGSLKVISAFRDSIDVLLRARLLDAPSHPGLLACLDGYDILRVIGMGGMGVVLLGRERRGPSRGDAPASSTPPAGKEAPPGSLAACVPASCEPARETGKGKDARSHWVAIKLLRPELLGNAKEVRRFLTEAQHMQRLVHPHILKVLAVSSATTAGVASPATSPDREQGTCPILKPKRPYFVMPYLEQGSLAELIHAGKIPEPRILDLAEQIAAALCYVHERGIVHRDLKPGNVLLDAGGHTYLTDFGLARTMENDASVDIRLPQRVGTSNYMSPAVAAGEAEDTRCDIYSFGALLYEMLTGRAPYQGVAPESILQRIQTSEPLPILSLNPGAPRGLVRIVEGAMARRLNDRYAQMADVVADVERVKHGQIPVGPRKPGQVPSVLPRILPAIWQRFGFKSVSLAAGLAGIVSLGAWFCLHPLLKVKTRVSLPGVFQWDGAKLGDWEGDGGHEVFLTHNNQLLVLTEQGPLIRQANIGELGGHDLGLDLIRDVDGDKADEIFLHWRSGTNLQITVLDNSLRPIRNFAADIRLPAGADARRLDGNLYAKGLLEKEAGGTRRFLAAVDTTQGAQSRGLYCFNFEDERILWFLPTESSLVASKVFEFHEDGVDQLIFGGRSVDLGGAAMDSTNRSQSALYAVSKQGKPLWERVLGGPNTQTGALLADLRGTGKKTIHAWVASQEETSSHVAPQASRIIQFDAHGQVVSEFAVPGSLLSCLAADLDHDGKKSLLATDNSGTLYVLDSDYRLQRKQTLRPKRFDCVDLRLVAVEDLNGDGLPELVLTCSQCEMGDAARPGQSRADTEIHRDNSILVVSADLRPIAEYLVARKSKGPNHFSVQVDDWNAEASPQIYCFANQLTILRLARGFSLFGGRN